MFVRGPHFQHKECLTRRALLEPHEQKGFLHRQDRKSNHKQRSTPVSTIHNWVADATTRVLLEMGSSSRQTEDERETAVPQEKMQPPWPTKILHHMQDTPYKLACAENSWARSAARLHLRLVGQDWQDNLSASALDRIEVHLIQEVYCTQRGCKNSATSGSEVFRVLSN